MNERSYRDGHPPYCTCVECLKNRKKTNAIKGKISLKNIIVTILSFLVVLSLVLPLFINFF